MICKECQKEYEKWIPEVCYENNLCLDCNAKKWEVWDAEHIDDHRAIAKLQKEGHSHHCACRIIWGDGECTCELERTNYDPYWWMKGKKS